MKRAPSPYRLLEAGLAVAYGAIVGSWLPLPERAPVIALPPAVVTSPPAAFVEASPGDAPQLSTLPVGWGGAEGGSARAYVPSPAAADGWGADTLPAAPAFAVATVTRRPEPGSIGAAGDVAPSARLGRPLGACAILEAGVEPPAECRRERERRTRSHCPPPGTHAVAGPVICIRADD